MFGRDHISTLAMVIFMRSTTPNEQGNIEIHLLLSINVGPSFLPLGGWVPIQPTHHCYTAYSSWLQSGYRSIPWSWVLFTVEHEGATIINCHPSAVSPTTDHLILAASSSAGVGWGQLEADLLQSAPSMDRGYLHEVIRSLRN